MALRLLRPGYGRSAPSPSSNPLVVPSIKGVDPELLRLLHTVAAEWTETAISDLIGRDIIPEVYVQQLAAAIKGKPSLWWCSDEEIVSAVAQINPTIADLLRSPRGIAWMHKMSEIARPRILKGALGFGVA